MVRLRTLDPPIGVRLPASQLLISIFLALGISPFCTTSLWVSGVGDHHFPITTAQLLYANFPKPASR